MSQTIGLAQACELGIQIGQGAFQHLTVAGLLHRLELLEDSPTGQVKRFVLLSTGGLLRRKSLF